MVDALRGGSERFRANIEQRVIQGNAADRIFQDIRREQNLGVGQRGPISRRVVREIAVPLRRRIIQQHQAFPRRADAILDARRAIQTNLSSPLGNRFQLQFQFTVQNPITGQIETRTNTIGFREPITLGRAREIALGRIDRINNPDFLFDSENLAALQRADVVADPNSLKFIGFFQLAE